MMPSILDFICPCCGKQIKLKIDESDGKITATLFYIFEASLEDVTKHGIELGIIPPGKVTNSFK